MSALGQAPAPDVPPVQAELFDDSDSIEHIDLFEPEQNSALFIGTVNVSPPQAAPQPLGPAPRPGITTAAHNLPSSRRPPIETRTPQALADDFIQWLRESLACGSLAVNTVHSAVHFCDEGMVLICPAIFQTYVATCTPPAPAMGAPTRSAPIERDKMVMQAVCSLGWHVRGVLNSSQLHFQWLQQRGVAPILLKGMLLPQPERLLDFVPPSNPALSRLT